MKTVNYEEFYDAFSMAYRLPEAQNIPLKGSLDIFCTSDYGGN